MPVLKCVSEEFLETMKSFVKSKAKNETVVNHFQAILEDAVPVCKPDKLFDIMNVENGDCISQEKVSRKRAKRSPSAYNKFIGKCLKERPSGQAVSEAMKSCGPRWKQMSDSEKERYG